MVCPRCPAVMVPAITAWVPWYRPHSTAALVAMMMNATSTPRALLRCTAAMKVFWVAPSKRCTSRASAVKLCTTGTALRISDAMALESARRSWLARDSLRTRRPNQAIGSTTSARITSTCAITSGLVQTSMARAPTPITALRRPIDSDEPTTVCTRVVSAVSRDSTSPVCVVSKNCGLCRSTWPYTALRRSALMRSPSQLTM